MAKIIEKHKSLKLRLSGLSIKEIASILGVSKSTVSGWCRDISLSDKHLKHLEEKRRSAGTKALLLAAERKRQKRFIDLDFYNKLGAQDVGKLDDRNIMMVALGLYWGEGYKKGSEEWGFTNNDPRMIKFMIIFLNRVCGVNRENLILRISINSSHKKREKVVKQFWISELKVKDSQFTKTSFIKSISKKVYPNFAEHYGTIRIKVKSGTNLRRRILGSIEYFQKFADENN
ncbi:MAG: helix-turn-helix domain-containing protein [Candidatus Paceibacterota bacterium]